MNDKQLRLALLWVIFGTLGFILLWSVNWKIAVGVFLMEIATYNSTKQELLYKLSPNKE